MAVLVSPLFGCGQDIGSVRSDIIQDCLRGTLTHDAIASTAMTNGLVPYSAAETQEFVRKLNLHSVKVNGGIHTIHVKDIALWWINTEKTASLIFSVYETVFVPEPTTSSAGNAEQSATCEITGKFHANTVIDVIRDFNSRVMRVATDPDHRVDVVSFLNDGRAVQIAAFGDEARQVALARPFAKDRVRHDNPTTMEPTLSVSGAELEDIRVALRDPTNAAFWSSASMH
jgi:hypothetical protein